MNALSLLNMLDNGLINGYDCDTRRTNMPKVDVKENNESYVLEMELPGFDENDIDIQIKEHVMSISSVKKETKKEDNKKDNVTYLIRERCISPFERSFKLPQDANEDNVSACFAKGILTITIKKAEIAQPKRISITAA